MSTIEISNDEATLLTAGYENFAEERWFSSVSSPTDDKRYEEILGANFALCTRQPQKARFVLVAQKSAMRTQIHGMWRDFAEANNSFALFCRFLAIVGGSATIGQFAGTAGSLAGALLGSIIFFRSTKWRR